MQFSQPGSYFPLCAWACAGTRHGSMTSIYFHDRMEMARRNDESPKNVRQLAARGNIFLPVLGLVKRLFFTSTLKLTPSGVRMHRRNANGRIKKGTTRIAGNFASATRRVTFMRFRWADDFFTPANECEAHNGGKSLEKSLGSSIVVVHKGEMQRHRYRDAGATFQVRGGSRSVSTNILSPSSKLAETYLPYSLLHRAGITKVAAGKTKRIQATRIESRWPCERKIGGRYDEDQGERGRDSRNSTPRNSSITSTSVRDAAG